MFSEKGCNQVVAGVGPGVGELGEGIGVGWVRRVWIEEGDGLGVHIASDNNYGMVGHLAKKSVLDALEVYVAEEFATIRQIMVEEGLEVACGLCYVEDRRQQEGYIAETFQKAVETWREGNHKTFWDSFNRK